MTSGSQLVSTTATTGKAELARLGDRDVLLLRVDDEDGVRAAGPGRRCRRGSGSASRAHGCAGGPPASACRRSRRPPAWPAARCMRPTRPDTVAKLVSMPPSQRWLTYGIPQASAYSATGPWVCFFVPTKRMVPPPATRSRTIGVGGLDAAQRLAQVDEIDPVALTQDVALHLRVPSPRLVAEVDPGLQELSHGNDGHREIPPVGCSPGAAPPDGRRPWKRAR